MWLQQPSEKEKKIHFIFKKKASVCNANPVWIITVHIVVFSLELLNSSKVKHPCITLTPLSKADIYLVHAGHALICEISIRHRVN